MRILTWVRRKAVAEVDFILHGTAVAIVMYELQKAKVPREKLEDMALNSAGIEGQAALRIILQQNDEERWRQIEAYDLG